MNPKNISLSIAGIFAANIILSLVIYANVIEKALFIDLPYFNSVQTIDTPIVLPDHYSNVNKNEIGLLGRPISIKFSRMGLLLDLSSPISQGDKWKITNSKTYILTLGKSYSGLLGDSVIFTSPNYYGLRNISQLTVGDRIFMETDKGYQYSYKVNKKIIEKYPYQIIGYPSVNKIIIVEPLKDHSDKGIVITAQYESVLKLI